MEHNDDTDLFEVKCACDAVPLFTTRYALMLESLGKFRSAPNFAVTYMGCKAFIEAMQEDPEFEVDEEVMISIMSMLAVSSLLHLQQMEVSICDAIDEITDTVRGIIPLNADEVAE